MSLLNSNVLHQLSRDELIHLLESIHGPKDIFVDGGLIKPLDRIAGASVLKEHGVEKIYRLSRTTSTGNSANQSRRQQVFLAHATTANVRLVCQHVHSAVVSSSAATLPAVGIDGPASSVSQTALLSAPTSVQYHLILVPKVLNTCRLIIESEGLCDILSLHGYNMGPIALDVDLWSMELPHCFRSLFIDGDTSLVEPIARWLHRLQSLCGTVPRVHAVGQAAQQVLTLFDLYDTVEREQQQQQKSTVADSHHTHQRHSSAPIDSSATSSHGASNAPEIGCLLLMDRNADFTSALLTPMTYAGLVNEAFVVRCGVVELPVAAASDPAGTATAVTGTQAATTTTTTTTAAAKSTKLALHSRDEIYGEVRDLPFSAVFSKLSARAKKLQSKHSSRQEMGISDMKCFIQDELRSTQAQHRSLATHIGMCEVIAAAAASSDASSTPLFNSASSSCPTSSSAPPPSAASAESERLRWLLERARLSCEHSLVDQAADTGDCLPYLYQLMALQAPLPVVLRLLCLLSLTSLHGLGRLPVRQYEQLVEQLVASYGFQQLVVVHRLQRLGLLTCRSESAAATAISSTTVASALVPGGVAAVGGSSWQSVAQRVAEQAAAAVVSIGVGGGSEFHAAVRKLRLVPQTDQSHQRSLAASLSSPSISASAEALSVCDRDGASYVFGGGYIPLVCRLFEATINGTWSAVEPVLRQLVGTDAVVTRTLPSVSSLSSQYFSSRDDIKLGQQRTLCVFMIGGATMAELAALQYTARQCDHRVLIITTSVITGSSLMQSVIEQ